MDQQFDRVPFLQHPDAQQLRDRLELLHRHPGKIRASNFHLPSLDQNTQLDNLSSVVGLSCFDMDGVPLGGPYFVSAASSLGSSRLEAVPTEVFTLRSDTSKRIVHWAVRPLRTMDVRTFERLWNYPTAAILQREVDVARDRQLLEPDSSRRLRDLQRAEQALRDHHPPPSIETLRGVLQRAIERVQTDSNPERTKEVDEASRALEIASENRLQWIPCGQAASAQPVKL